MCPIQVIGVILLIAVLLISCLVLFLYWFLSSLFDSILPIEVENSDAPKSVANDVPDRNPLCRHVPSLRHKLVWEELGIYPTPVHSVVLDLPSEKRVSFWMKREDLSSPIYGGNKVRTLQYQIPACRAQVAKHPSSQIFVVGSGGSNQVVATLTHGSRYNINFHISYPMPDAPDLDNTLNLLSTLSFGPLSMMLWDHLLPQVRRLISVILSKNDKVFGLGGNSIGGILGQMGGAIELAEQIEAGEVADPDEIYLPMGSSCTTTGLILGVCLARHLKMNAFKSHRFKIVSIAIHGGFAALNRKTNFMRNFIGKYLLISPQFGISRTSAYFKKLTGIDLESAALKFLKEEWELVDRADIAGDYGGHSEKSAKASALDNKFVVNGPIPSWLSGEPAPLPWMCGHFTGKSFAVMLERLEGRADIDNLNVLLWQTKSTIQPLGSKDEWETFQSLARDSIVLKHWSDEGKSASVLRNGKVNVLDGTPSDYRPLMKKVL